MRVAPDKITLSCPACSAPNTTEVWRVVDAGQQPDLKRRLLRGQLNVITCPSCSNLTAVATPLAYHDPAKELLLILLPTRLGLSAEEQEKTIGEFTNLVMNSLPAEQRRGYLFQPKTFFSMESLRLEILRADGITDEMMQEQMRRGQLVRDLLGQMEDEETFEELLEERRNLLDYEFFLFLTATIDQAREEGDEPVAQQLTALREKLQQSLTPEQVSPSAGLEGAITREDLIERLFSRKDSDDFKTLIAIARPVLDYQFFQTLTGQIEAAEGRGEHERAGELTGLRTRILDLVDELDKEARVALDRASALLRQIVDSDDMEAAAEEKLEQIDAVFLTALEANIIAADRSGQAEILERLNKLKEHVVSLLEARLPPEMRLINQLVSAPELGERRRLLAEQADIVSENFLKLLNLIIDDLRSQNQEEAVGRLAEMVPEVENLLQAQKLEPTTEQGS
ncbi:MAG: CpXC domain-containing protein [Anaerolineae bacterium]|nr:CpXC domain-containing protein [Anaerolineae bacterium]